MIQTFTYTTPHTGNPETLVTQANNDMTLIMRRHRSLLGGTVTATDTDVTMVLRVSSHDRWRGSAAARNIAVAVLRRLKLQVSNTVLVSVVPERNARSLTGEEGRPKPTQRKAGRSQRERYVR